MSTQDAIVVVLIGAIFANLMLAIGLIIGPRIRARREGSVAPGHRTIEASTTAIPRTLVAARPVPVGPGGSILPDLEAASLRRPSAVSPPVAAPAPADRDEAPPKDAVSGFELVPSWSKWLAEEGARIERYGRLSTIVLIELPGIDRVAERLGQEAADRLIPPIAATMRRHARASDSLARLGRARFGALLTETDEVRAINFIERVRAACDVWLESGAVSLRLAIGWAEIGGNQPVDVALPSAEQRLNEERQRLRARTDTGAGLDATAEADVDAAVMVPATQG